MRKEESLLKKRKNERRKQCEHEEWQKERPA